MPLESLLVSRDPQVIRVLRPALEKLAIEVEICRGADSGSEILSCEKFDAVIVDCDDLHGGLGVLETLRRTASNRNSITFAILNGHHYPGSFSDGREFCIAETGLSGKRNAVFRHGDWPDATRAPAIFPAP